MLKTTDFKLKKTAIRNFFKNKIPSLGDFVFGINENLDENAKFSKSKKKTL